MLGLRYTNIIFSKWRNRFDAWNDTWNQSRIDKLTNLPKKRLTYEKNRKNLSSTFHCRCPLTFSRIGLLSGKSGDFMELMRNDWLWEILLTSSKWIWSKYAGWLLLTWDLIQGDKGGSLNVSRCKAKHFVKVRDSFDLLVPRHASRRKWTSGANERFNKHTWLSKIPQIDCDGMDSVEINQLLSDKSRMNSIIYDTTICFASAGKWNSISHTKRELLWSLTFCFWLDTHSKYNLAQEAEMVAASNDCCLLLKAVQSWIHIKEKRNGNSILPSGNFLFLGKKLQKPQTK